ncbi:hypothetical protein BX600DRAFT_2044 [Xylariales sp. PMI_506]|nr:hypothetical protein BX600DRAFT_2044 [Xylariales sp. PMI_506]
MPLVNACYTTEQQSRGHEDVSYTHELRKQLPNGWHSPVEAEPCPCLVPHLSPCWGGQAANASVSQPRGEPSFYPRKQKKEVSRVFCMKIVLMKARVIKDSYARWYKINARHIFETSKSTVCRSHCCRSDRVAAAGNCQVGLASCRGRGTFLLSCSFEALTSWALFKLLGCSNINVKVKGLRQDALLPS